MFWVLGLEFRVLGLGLRAEGYMEFHGSCGGPRDVVTAYDWESTLACPKSTWVYSLEFVLFAIFELFACGHHQRPQPLMVTP